MRCKRALRICNRIAASNLLYLTFLDFLELHLELSFVLFKYSHFRLGIPEVIDKTIVFQLALFELLFELLYLDVILFDLFHVDFKLH